MSERAVFLDRDNTIIENDGYLGDPSKVKLLPGAATALASIRGLGYRLIVVSNQSGVGRGMFKETDVEAVNDEMSRQLKEKAGAYIDASYYCPYHPEATIADYKLDHDWRKPKPGMLKQAAADFSLDLAQCWMIGDAPRDIAAGDAAGCRTILLRDPDKNPVSNAEAIAVSPNFVVKTLADAARIIVREGRTHPAALSPAAVAKPAGTSAAGPEPRAASTQSAALTLTGAAPDPVPLATDVPPPPVPQSAAASATDASKAAPVPIRPATPRQAIGEETGPAEKSGTTSSWTGRLPPSHLEKSLEDLVIQLRNQNRNADMQPDFSFSTIAAIICQLFAVAAFLIGFFTYFTRTHSLASSLDAETALQSLLGAIVWMGGALFLQGLVITLLIHARNKER